MAEVAVRKGIGSTLEEDDDGVEFAKRTNTRVIDVVVDVLGRDAEVRDGVYAVEEGHDVPCRVEAAQRCCVFCGCVGVALGGYAGVGSVCLPGCGQLDEVCDEEVGWDEEVEEEAGDDVGAAVVVAAEAYEDAVLLELALEAQWNNLKHTFCRFTIISRRLETMSTKIMRFLKPTKLGFVAASWLKHDGRVEACVAKTWRYFVSRMRLVVLLAFCSVAFAR
jgi:hypothetical protein